MLLISLNLLETYSKHIETSNLLETLKLTCVPTIFQYLLFKNPKCQLGKGAKIKKWFGDHLGGGGSAKMIRVTTSLLGFSIKICTKHKKGTNLCWGGGLRSKWSSDHFLKLFYFCILPLWTTHHFWEKGGTPFSQTWSKGVNLFPTVRWWSPNSKF